MRQREPLNGKELLAAIKRNVEAALDARHDIFSMGLAYPIARWQVTIKLEYLNGEQTVESHGEVQGYQATDPTDTVPEPLLEELITFGNQDTNPDSQRETPSVQLDRGEGAGFLSSPENAGIVRISKP